MIVLNNAYKTANIAILVRLSEKLGFFGFFGLHKMVSFSLKPTHVKQRETLAISRRVHQNVD